MNEKLKRSSFTNLFFFLLIWSKENVKRLTFNHNCYVNCNNYIFISSIFNILTKKCTTLWIRITSTHHSKITFLQNKYTYTAHQYWGKVSKILHTFCLYLRLPAIVNLIFRIVRLKKLMTSCRDKPYQHTISNKIKFNF